MDISSASSDGSAASIERADERKGRDKVIGDRTRNPRGLAVVKDIAVDHGSVDRKHSTVIGSQDRSTTARNVFDAVTLDAKVVLIDRLKQREHPLHPIGRQTEDIEAVPSIRKAKRGAAILLMFVEKSLRQKAKERGRKRHDGLVY